MSVRRARRGVIARGRALAAIATFEVQVDNDDIGTSDRTWEYVGAWQTATGSAAFGGGDTYTSVTGATATLRGTGTRLVYRSATAPNHGIVNVSVDGGAPVAVDLYSPTRVDDVAVFDTGNLPNGAHTLTVTCTGARHASSTGSAAVVDRGTVWSSTFVPTLDYGLFPYDANSVWKLGVASAATRESSTDTRTANLLNNTGSGKVWVNYEDYSHDMVRASESDPIKTMADRTDSNRSRSYRIPVTQEPSPGDDAHMHTLDPDGVTLHEAFGVIVTGTGESKTYTAQRVETSVLTGSGIGPTAGTRAYGGGALGGLARHHELDPADPAFQADPRYPGQDVPLLKHAASVALRPDQFKDTTALTSISYYTDNSLTNATEQPGWQVGINRNGFMMRAFGYVWPATELDYTGPTEYTGTVPMGAYLIIPGTTARPAVGNIAALTSTEKAILALFHQMQDYGAYATDKAGSFVYYVETKNAAYPASDAFVSSLRNSDAAALRTVFQMLRICTSNNYASPNGGPLGAGRRA